MATKCLGLMGRIFGHKFRPIITLSATTFNSVGVRCKAHVALEMADKHRDESLHGCICQRCGAVERIEAFKSVTPSNIPQTPEDA